MTPFRLCDDAHGAATPLVPGTTLLEASAGTGKTFTIAGLVARLVLEQGMALDRIAVMTFTTAATAELRERIRARIASLDRACRGLSSGDAVDQAMAAAHRAQPPDLRRAHLARLRAATGCVDLAPIVTIHGFARRIATEHAAVLGLDPAAATATDLGPWRTETVHDWLRRNLRTAAAAVVAMVGDQPVDRLVALARQAEHLPHANVEPAGITVAEVTSRSAEILAVWPGLRADIERAVAAVVTGIRSNAVLHPAKLNRRLDRLAAAIDGTGPTSDLDIADELADSDRIQKATRKGCPTLDPAPFAAAAAAVARLRALAATLLAGFVAEYRTALAGRMRQHHDSHVDDPLRALDAALDGPSGAQIARAVGERYQAVLVDEFQDTDARQWRILTRCFAGPDHHLLLIGDPKQAIYRFRGADVHTYLAARRTVASERQFTLTTNFRSDAGLVASLNRLYHQRVADPFGLDGISYHVVAAKHADGRFATTAGDSAPLQILQVPASLCHDADATSSAVAAAVADEIRRLCDPATGATLTHAGRRAFVHPGDIAVLVRRHSDGDRVARALRQRGIPSVRNDKASVFTAPMAQTWADLLAACLDPRHDVTVRTAAAGRLVGAPAAALLADADPRLAALPVRLLDLGEVLATAGVAAWWYRCLDTDLGWGTPRQRVCALDDAERHVADLAHLVELASAAQAEQRLAATGVARWVDQRLAGAGDGESEDEQRHLDRDDAAVRIVTLHVAKGMQYPVVFEAFAWRSVRSDTQAGLIVHAEDAVRWQMPGLAATAADSDQHAREALGDDLRKLYVGLTRAEHRCYVVWADLPATQRSVGSTQSALGLLLFAPDLPSSLAQPLDALAARVAPHLDDPGSLDATGLSVRIATPGPPIRWTPPDRASMTVADAPILDGTPILPRWYRSSFTGLSRTVTDDADDGRDHDRLVSEPAAQDGLPAGADFGTSIHRLFEEADFGTWAGAIGGPIGDTARELRQAGFTVDDAAVAALAMRVQATVATAIPQIGVPLSRIGATALAREWPVRLPVATRSPPLDRIFAGRTPQAPDWPRRLASVRLPGGTFEGVIDAVVHAAGRWHVIDWKTNRLRAYDQATLWEAMADHDYILQAHLYLVAVHRHLRCRLGETYDIASHLGCAAYAFIRGCDAAQPGAGWSILAPDPAVIEELDACFAPA